MKLLEFSKAHIDLKWVIKIGTYPLETLYKIYQRLGMVLQKLQKTSESIEAFARAVQLIKEAKLTSDQKEKNTKELEDNMKATKLGSAATKNTMECTNEALEIIEEHNELKGSTIKLGVKFNENMGRHAFANDVIEPGEVICKFKPVASIILFGDSMNFCYHCLDHVISPIPCSKCSGVVFCSLFCKDESKSRHSNDCPLSLMDLFLSKQKFGTETATASTFLALKALGMKSAQFFINHCATFDEPQEQKLPITTGQFDKLDVFFNSVTHLDTTLQKLDKIFMSIFLYQCLKESRYFDNVRIDGLNDHFKDLRRSPDIFFTSLIFHFMLASYSNSFALQVLMSQNKKQKYGLAIFPASTLLNHSCNPNTTVVTQKNFQVTVASKRIFPGEEICHIYQGHFADTLLEKRKQLMGDYFHFICNCLACTQNYPLYSQLDKTFDNEEYFSLTSAAQDAFSTQNYTKGLDIMTKRLTIISDNLQEPHQLFIQDRAAFIECLWQCYANKIFQTHSKFYGS